jgi:hypothetical protein
MNLPRNGVLVVQNVPTTGPDRALPGFRTPLGYPRPGDVTVYGCLNGDAFVEGVLDGRLTVAADNDVVITWDLTYKDGFHRVTADDTLGLIASNNVAIHHPVTSGGRTLTSGRRVAGAAATPDTRCKSATRSCRRRSSRSNTASPCRTSPAVPRSEISPSTGRLPRSSGGR